MFKRRYRLSRKVPASAGSLLARRPLLKIASVLPIFCAGSPGSPLPPPCGGNPFVWAALNALLPWDLFFAHRLRQTREEGPGAAARLVRRLVRGWRRSIRWPISPILILATLSAG
jgi:hypothetical protein